MNPTREELRQRLRAKIRGARNQQPVEPDVQSTLLNAVGDDPEAMKMVHAILKHPKAGVEPLMGGQEEEEEEAPPEM